MVVQVFPLLQLHVTFPAMTVSGVTWRALRVESKMRRFSFACGQDVHRGNL